MKKITSLLLVLLAFVSCQSDVRFSDPAFQGQKDNHLWRADVVTSTVSNGIMTLRAKRGAELVELVFPAPAEEIEKKSPVTHTFGLDENITAGYQRADQDLTFVYKTGQNIGNGELVITGYDPITRRLTGSFRFNAVYQGDIEGTPENANFQDGFIYNIQL